MVKLFVQSLAALAIINAVTPASADLRAGFVSIQADGARQLQTSESSTAASVDCSCWLSEGAVTAGIAIIPDASCADTFTAGCIGMSCRFCRSQDTPQSAHLLACGGGSGTVASTSSISSGGAAAATTAAPAITCGNIQLSSGDVKAGVSLATDATCVMGGVGCVGTTCRYCRASEISPSSHLLLCDSIAGYGTPPTAASTISATGASATNFSPLSVVAAMCAKFSTIGDRAQGILVASDDTCSKGGIGCIGVSCRFCKSKDTPQSASFMPCTGMTVPPVPVTAATAATTTSTTTTTAPTTSPATTAPVLAPASVDPCSKFSTTGDRGVGISVVSDAMCAKGGTGCIGSLCRFCRVQDTAQSLHLFKCSSLAAETAGVTEYVSVEASTAEGVSGSVDDEPSSTLLIGLMGTVGAAVGVMAFAAKRMSNRKRETILTTPMCIDHRSPSLADI